MPEPASGPLTGDSGHGGRPPGCCSDWERWNLNIGECGQGLGQRDWRRRLLSSAFIFPLTQCWNGKSWTPLTTLPCFFLPGETVPLG